MGLNELLEEQSVKSISLRTMISEDNIKRVASEDYSGLTKAKALGFLSILEREYQLDLKDVRNNAIAYFEMQSPEEITANIALPRVEEAKGRSKLVPIIILGLLGYASWYFFTQFDKKTLNSIVPFGSEHNKTEVQEDKKESIFSVAINEDTTKKVEVVPTKNNNHVAEVTETKVVVPTVNHNITESVQENVMVVKDEPTITVVSEKKYRVVTVDANSIVEVKNTVNTQTTNIETEVNSTTLNEKKIIDNKATDTNEIFVVKEKVVKSTKVFLKPVKRLWFGLVNMRTGKRDHFSIRKAFTIDLSKGNWLVATSPAPFSLVFGDKTNIYNNGTAHYFMVRQDGIISLTKRAYVAKGGYKKW